MTAPLEPSEQNTPTPTPSFLKRVAKTADDALFDMLGIPDKPNDEKIAKLSTEKQKQLREIEEEAIAKFSGDLTQLEAALGMLRMGHHFGWRVLYILHSKRTIRNYEAILGNHKIRDLFPETGPSSYRSVGLNLANRFSNFWKVVSGDIKIPKRQEAI